MINAGKIVSGVISGAAIGCCALSVAFCIIDRSHHKTEPVLSGVTGNFIPFVLVIEDQNKNQVLEASLNQDGSWTLTGDIEAAMKVPSLDYGSRCVLDQLHAQHVVSNAHADNTRNMSFDVMGKIVVHNPVTAPCAVYIYGEDHSPAGRNL
jgi:hypothetical protein